MSRQIKMKPTDGLGVLAKQFKYNEFISSTVEAKESCSGTT